LDKKPYIKPHKTYDEQLVILKKRGLVVSDEPQAILALKQFNYYRLAAYFKVFETNTETHELLPQTSLEQVITLYCFDRHLRLLVMDAIERIEVSMRSTWAYHIAENHGSHAHLDATLAKNYWYWHQNSGVLHRQLEQSQAEAFINHFNINYQEPTPPVWVVCEVMTLGLLSKYYANLKVNKTRDIMAKTYGLRPDFLESWLQHLNEIRNICAHHSRLWNRLFISTPLLPTKKLPSLKGCIIHGKEKDNQHKKIYNSLAILLYWMDVIEPEHQWRTALLALLHQHPTFLPRMGFPAHWASHAIWSKTHA
jgi:abortive infection bacteriophage resistance protein